ncbi:stalk domain-containing protein [Paenibacillus piri]|uniref:3D domain-containing protein n=1 Tax=Paenibacillus piri TaxID=2547395 RepID=A0A4R5K567_9BACL|nr:stalk domain-containing protein [Paenibacillus piri]TDF87722.1 hypothetical protein E1757_35480 [Paenibacillus piri]
MNHFVKSIALSTSLMAAFLAPVYTAHAAPPLSKEEVRVQINDKLVDFSDAQPYLDSAHQLHVPVRSISEKLGLEAQPEAVGQGWKVTLKDQDTSFSFMTGSKNASVNGKQVELGAAPQFMNGKVYIPLRSLANSLQIRLQWDANNRIAILNEDNQYHAPAWYAPQHDEVIEAKATAYTGSADENGGYASLDYFGNPLQVGTISVDPKVIPLGSKVYIEGYQFDGLPAGGMYATATDIGNAIKGNKIDIYIPGSKNQAMQFGVQQVKIYKLKSD